jgi:tetratricopeptide (TPR) repeat protein
MKAWAGLFLKILVVLAILGLIGYWAGRQLWAAYHFREAHRAVDRYDFLDACNHYRNCLSVWSNDAETLWQAGRCARRGGYFDDARHWLAEFERLRGTGNDLGLEKTLMAAQQGDLPPQKEQQLRLMVLKKVPETPLVLEALAQGFLYAYRLDEALDCVVRLLRLLPDHLPALMWRGYIHEGLGQLADAEKDYEEIVKLQPEHFAGRLRLAEVLLAQGRAETACRELESLREKHADSWEVLLDLAQCRLALGQKDEAQQFLGEVLTRNANQPLAQRLLGHMELAGNEPARAEALLRRALDANSADLDACSALEQAYVKQGKSQEAEECRIRRDRLQGVLEKQHKLREQIRREPDNTRLRFEMGQSCQEIGQEREARRWFVGVVQLDPEHAGARSALARIDRGDTKEPSRPQ